VRRNAGFAGLAKRFVGSPDVRRCRGFELRRHVLPRLPFSYCAAMSLESEMPQRMLNAAVAFYQAGVRCEQPVWISPTKVYHLSGPSVACLAFSIELYLKLVILLTQQRKARGHKLLELFDELDLPTREIIVGSHMLAGDPDFVRESFETVSSDFELWRYAHEHEFIMTSPTTLNDLAKALHKAVQRIKPDLISVFDR
jgi:hypothetical protein